MEEFRAVVKLSRFVDNCYSSCTFSLPTDGSHSLCHFPRTAYAGVFVGRAAYDWSCEVIVYLDHNAQKCGLGRKIYEVLENELHKMGILNLYACIGYPEKEDKYLTTNSADFHAHLGFVKVGEFHKCGYKFDRWYNMIWMEKVIGKYEVKQPLLIPYPELGNQDR